jgi:hypothetical protein
MPELSLETEEKRIERNGTGARWREEECLKAERR